MQRRLDVIEGAIVGNDLKLKSSRSRGPPDCVASMPLTIGGNMLVGTTPVATVELSE